VEHIKCQENRSGYGARLLMMAGQMLMISIDLDAQEHPLQMTTYVVQMTSSKRRHA
jgi:hypothetical protein